MGEPILRLFYKLSRHIIKVTEPVEVYLYTELTIQL